LCSKTQAYYHIIEEDCNHYLSIILFFVAAKITQTGMSVLQSAAQHQRRFWENAPYLAQHQRRFWKNAPYLPTTTATFKIAIRIFSKLVSTDVF
jgi:hypothetical protein